MWAESATAPAPCEPQIWSHIAPAARTSSYAACPNVPLQTRIKSRTSARHLAVARRLRKEAASTDLAPAHARRARVPFVVLIAIRFPRTFSRVNSRGEL